MDLLNSSRPLILASSSPRRKQLLEQHGYQFTVDPPSEGAECGVCSGETPPELVVRLARQKAADVALRYDSAIILACDTVAECHGQVLGKPRDRDDARRMLSAPRKTTPCTLRIMPLDSSEDKTTLQLDTTTLVMDDVSDEQLESYLDTNLWEGKAGAFGYQDGWDWLHIIEGSESNVIGLPMEKVRLLTS